MDFIQHFLMGYIGFFHFEMEDWELAVVARCFPPVVEEQIQAMVSGPGQGGWSLLDQCSLLLCALLSWGHLQGQDVQARRANKMDFQHGFMQ